MYVNHLHWITSWVPWYQWHSLQQTCPVINLIKNFKIRFLFLTFHQLRELKQSFLEFPCYPNVPNANCHRCCVLQLKLACKNWFHHPIHYEFTMQFLRHVRPRSFIKNPDLDFQSCFSSRRVNTSCHPLCDF